MLSGVPPIHEQYVVKPVRPSASPPTTCLPLGAPGGCSGTWRAPRFVPMRG